MDGDEVYGQLSSALRRLAADGERNDKSIAELAAVLDMLLQLMQLRGDLSEGNLRMVSKLRARAERAAQPHLQLDEGPDKHEIEGVDIDCRERMHLCHGRCCAFHIPLSRKDVLEDKLQFRIDEPYLLAQTAEGYCVYQARETGFCDNYERRPATCRRYDCRGDRRVWIDFEARIPAPMPGELVTIRRRGKVGVE